MTLTFFYLLMLYQEEKEEEEEEEDFIIQMHVETSKYTTIYCKCNVEGCQKSLSHLSWPPIVTNRYDITKYCTEKQPRFVCCCQSINRRLMRHDITQAITI